MATPVEWLNEFQVNTGTADVGGISDPQVVGLAGGNYLVAWVEAGTTGVGTTPGDDIIGKIFDAEGNLVRDSFRINTFGNADDERDFDIAATNDGGFSMVYVDDSLSNSAAEQILYQRFDDNGDAVAGTSKILVTNTVAADVLSNPKIVVNNNDNSAYVTFTDNVGAGADEIRALRIDEDGVVLTAEFDAGANTAGQFSRDAEAAINTNGELVTVYEEDDGGFAGIELMIRNTAGVQQHNINVVTGSASLSASDPHVATLTNGNIAVTWTEDNDVYYAVYDINAGVVKAKAAVTSTALVTNEPSIAALPQGGFVIVFDNDSANTLQARRYNNDGTTDATDTLFTIEATAGAEIAPNVAATADGRILFTWEEGDNVFSNIWDTRGGNVDANDFDGLPLNFVETNTTTTNVIDTTLTGDSDADTLLGQGGDDFITGGSAADSIEGGAGNDTIDGGLFIDTVNGGAGDDSIVIAAGNAADEVDGGSGSDTLDYSASGLSDDLIFTGFDSGTYANGQTFDNIEVVKAGTAGTTIDLFFGNQNVDGGAGNDLFLHGDGEFIDTLHGGAGDDTLDLSAAVGASEAVNIDQGAGTWTGLGGTRDISGFESIIGTQENDTILGGNLADTIDGQAGDDFIDVGGPVDFTAINVMGGTGNDTIVANNSSAETLDGGAGIDLLDTTKYNGSYNIDLAAGTTNFGEVFINFENVTTGNGNDTITGTNGANIITTNDGADSIDAGGGNDTVSAGADNDFVNAGTGSDLVSGGTGNDTLDGLNGADTLNGNDGNDRLIGGGGNDSLNGGNDNDTLLGGNNNDTLIGGGGNDNLFGEIGQDFLSGGAGNDSLAGGNAKDTLLGGDGDDTLLGQGSGDYMDGGIGNDSMDGGATDDTMFGGAGMDTVKGGAFNDTVNGGGDNDTVDGGSGNDVVNGDGGNDSVTGGSGNDTVDGGTGNDTVDGGIGEDVVNGGGGSDMLTGGNANDTLDGGDGGDTVDGGSGGDLLIINSGEGGDVLFGGAGTDTFDFEAGFITAKIEDFNSGQDTVDLVDAVAGSFAALTITYSGGGTSATVDVGGGDEIIFNNLTSALSASDFDF